jgi:hypothetical protein
MFVLCSDDIIYVDCLVLLVELLNDVMSILSLTRAYRMFCTLQFNISRHLEKILCSHFFA